MKEIFESGLFPIVSVLSVVFCATSILLWRRKRKNELKVESRFSRDEDPIESELRDLEARAHKFLVDGRFVDSERVAWVGYRRVVMLRGADFWRAAVMLNRVASAQINQGKHREALQALDAAASVLSEWPDYADEHLGCIELNRQYCRDYLGY